MIKIRRGLNIPLAGAPEQRVAQDFAPRHVALVGADYVGMKPTCDEVSVVGRNTQGVRIIRLKENENLVSLARIAEPEEDDFIDSEGAEDSPESNSSED